MRNSVGISLILALSLSGCGAITRDLRHPGGYPGHLLDERTFDASESKEVQLLRFTIILAMAARMAGESANDAKDADAVAEYLSATADEINYAAANIYPSAITPCRVRDATLVNTATRPPADRLATAVAQAERSAADAARSAQVAAGAETSVRAALAAAVPPAVIAPAPPPPSGCDGYYVNFEADVPLVEARMMRPLFATLPRDHIRKFAEDIQKGNFLGSAWNAVKVVFVGVRGLHTASGTYRSGQEILVANFSTCSKAATGAPSISDYDEQRWNVQDAVACLGLSGENLFGPHPGEIAAVDIPPQISEDSFRALMQIARTSCVRLPIGTADNDDKVLLEARKDRAAQCAKLAWNPKRRPDSITP